ncbi:MAG: hypothetical protein MUE85_11485 [Microscillaceae bacterium]|jgi:hypothetical protein|nr:hypothetical protein [Microscillaceae bacterium]
MIHLVLLLGALSLSPNQNLLNSSLSDSYICNSKTLSDNDEIYLLYYFGILEYDEALLNKIGKKYQVRWEYAGCTIDAELLKHNRKSREKLKALNGEMWEVEFWAEVKK